MNFSEVLKKIPTPQVSMPHIPQLPKLNVSSGKEDLGKPPISMTQEDMQQLIHNIGESVLIPEDGAFVALWILTLIDHWNNEHERVIILTERNFYILRYDFLQCRIRDSRRIGLGQVTSVVTGPLVFPSKSLMPIRSSPGVQMKWGDDTDVKLVQKWNPLCRSLPYATLTHHPAYSKRDQLPPRQGEVPGAGFEDASNPVALYDVNNFLCALKEACVGTNVQFSSGDIIIESYGNLGSVVFNQTSLGFTKTKVATPAT
ncbi:Tumor protein p63-regulated protein [Paragonimus heterotremus]|uniref:Tumor protein p63-regulated protein n=1 Tax=Paragonimus heterotremus TaxID=100268 RepID=A0A8J4TC12_9TREM|nr:Tumor protein p63-regulated protein [Paragonimus heterotremus]